MRWTVFTMAAYVVLVLQVGLARHLSLGTSNGNIQPEFVLLLAVFIALSAPTRTVVIACGVLGALVDLVASPYAMPPPADQPSTGSVAVTLIGPYALAYMAGGYLVVQLRPMLMRQHPLTLGAMTLAAGVEAHLIVLALLWIRNWYDPLEGFTASSQYIPRALSLLYTAGIGTLIAYPLIWASPAFGFPSAKHNPSRT